MAKSNLRQFDYRKVAELDCRIWQAYYSHKFIRLFFLTVQLLRTQLRLSLYRTLKMSYYFSIASVEYRLNKKHMSSDRTLKNLTKFYRIISTNSTQPFDFVRAAQMELDWWNVQRYDRGDKKALQLGLAKTFAVVYHTQTDKVLAYGRYRTDALDLKNKYLHVEHIEPKWHEIEKLLLQSWKSLHEAVQK